MTTGVPGVVETVEARGETTLVVDPARIVEACTHLRDEEGYNVLVDLSGVDYRGWERKGVAGHTGTTESSSSPSSSHVSSRSRDGLSEMRSSW